MPCVQNSPTITELLRQKLEGYQKFNASLLYMLLFSLTRTTQKILTQKTRRKAKNANVCGILIKIYIHVL